MIIDAFEIIDSLRLKVSEGLICEYIDTTEETFFTGCMGYDTFEYLRGIMVDYTDGDDYQGAFDLDVTYTVDQQVLYRGRVYERKTADITGQITPDCSSDWEILSKFSEECYETLWNRYLKKALSHCVYATALPFMWLIVDDKGIFIQEDTNTGQSTASQHQLNALVKQHAQMGDSIVALMKNFVKRENAKDQGCNYEETNLVDCGCDDQDCNTGNKNQMGRRWVFPSQNY